MTNIVHYNYASCKYFCPTINIPSRSFHNMLIKEKPPLNEMSLAYLPNSFPGSLTISKKWKTVEMSSTLACYYPSKDNIEMNQQPANHI